MGIFEESRCITLQMHGIEFNHLDRKSRYQQVISVLNSSDPSRSFPNLFKDQHQLKGLYRLLNNKSVSHSKFISGYQAGLVQYSKEQDKSTPWILVQDTMLTDYHSRKVLDLGYTQTEHSNGFLLHHGLLLDAEAIPLGLLHQQVIHREREKYKQARTPEDKESKKWINAITTGVEFSKQTGRSLIHLMDREADIADIINAANSHDGQYFIIRAAQNRILTNAEGKLSAEKLFTFMPSLHTGDIIERRLIDEKGKSYQANCTISHGEIHIKGVDKSVRCVWVKELQQEQAADRKEPAEWFLLTNLPADDYTHEVIAGYYSKRWVIEDFHKCYKTGCSIEKRQFDSRETLTNGIGLLALTAVVLLRSRYFAQNDHDAPFETIVTDAREQLLAKKIAGKYLKPIDATIAKPYTALWWLLLMGRMGGHQGFKQKGLPGWQTLWKGYSFFQSLMLGFSHADNAP
ncbi:IS4 family transposase [Mucilaginibacter angelicae]|uniref:IS4 family transposase n=1 Tax=Mucilaginibacter angelicae TaxID=869718 RepID=A0ABV6LBH2_9SPHI